LNALHWDARVDPRGWQPRPTVLEAVARHGREVYHVAPGGFRESGLTRAALRGTRYVPAETAGDLVAGIASAAGGATGSLVLGYHADLDRTGHLRGCTSAAWKHQLAVADRLVEQVIRVLPEDALLVVTGDHGMVDVPADGCHDADLHPDLRTGVALLGGEPRTRYVYTEPGAAEDVLATWREVLGGSAWVVSRDEAVEVGWFGPCVADTMRARIGDVVAAAATEKAAVVASLTAPGEVALVGMHGSMTAAEMRVPLVLALGAGGRPAS
ncbi:MAG TPA: alkaline phosphatase family protein, partial [Cryptosporangiaceae bacterium]|nr:alkaline phosphatase family protein [Cryptosporangiaceae bacterium]